MQPHAIRREFFKGNHREVVRKTVDSGRAPTIASGCVPWIVGALCHLGRVGEAEALYAQEKAGLDEDDRVSSRFYLGIAHCRQSHYAESARLFAENLRASRHSGNPLRGFYVYQGLGFYHYFSGRLRASLRASARAFNFALEARFLYGKALAADLKGHSLVQTGQVALGLSVLEGAREWAESLGADWLHEAIGVSILTYRTRFGWEGGMAAVKKKLGALSRQDSYSGANLLLELGQGYLLRGRLADAREALNTAMQIIYASQNRRQEALLNLRYAYLQYLSGDSFQALNLVRNTQKGLDARVDRLLRLKAVGMERFLSARLGMTARAEDLDGDLAKLTREAGEGIGARMLRRESEAFAPLTAIGDDRVGELKDEISRLGDGSVERVLESGYLTFLHDVLRIRPGERIVYFDLVPGSLTVFDGGEVSHVAEGVTPILRALGARLAGGAMSKKRLIEEIWGYAYHPLRHDGLVYAAVTKLRRMLGARAYWLEASGDGYALGSRVAVRFPTPLAPAVAAPEAVIPLENPAVLNHRQVRILRYLTRNEFIDTPTALRLFKCSEITASRDLATLARQGLVTRLGRARATKYTRRFTSADSPR